MSDYDNSGILFKNHTRTKDNHPWYEGTATVNGVEYKISSWVKDGKTPNKKTGKIEKFMTLSFKPSDEMDQRRTPAPKENEFGEPEDIPF